MGEGPEGEILDEGADRSMDDIFRHISETGGVALSVVSGISTDGTLTVSRPPEAMMSAYEVPLMDTCSGFDEDRGACIESA